METSKREGGGGRAVGIGRADDLSRDLEDEIGVVEGSLGILAVVASARVDSFPVGLAVVPVILTLVMFLSLAKDSPAKPPPTNFSMTR